MITPPIFCGRAEMQHDAFECPAAYLQSFPLLAVRRLHTGLRRLAERGHALVPSPGECTPPASMPEMCEEAISPGRCAPRWRAGAMSRRPAPSAMPARDSEFLSHASGHAADFITARPITVIRRACSTGVSQVRSLRRLSRWP